MARDYNTTFRIELQGFICENSERFESNRRILEFHSCLTSKDVCCPCCSKRVIGHGIRKVRLTDIPFEPGIPTVYEVFLHRYLCKSCGKIFTEQNPFKAPGFFLTKRCVQWIFELLKYKFPTSAIASFLGLEWNTVRKLEKMKIDYILEQRDEETRCSDYRPQFLAIDEFAIRKGHRYATCVMDLVRGDILWVGKGRAIKDFSKFFEKFGDSDLLSQVKAVAMDMNASYNRLVQKHLPNAAIVYDRYHVQAQFGRDVLGQVRLDEARRHKENAKIQAGCTETSKEELQVEKQRYRQVKKARWILLQNEKSLSAEKEKSLHEILETHADLAVCYAMKEELVSLFEIRDETLARERWTKWFDAAIGSSIPALAKFGRQKRKRIEGLIAHAKHPINTGKLEGFNNKIKVAKRNAFGFRNLNFFFAYIRYLSIPNGYR